MNGVNASCKTTEKEEGYNYISGRRVKINRRMARTFVPLSVPPHDR